MAQKSKSVYICENCGYEAPKWSGQCPSCGEWNTMQEGISVAAAPSKSPSAAKPSSDARAMKLSEISSTGEHRYKTGFSELDRVLGGGIVKGAVMLISGDPGIGKSTIMLQICQKLSELNVLYVSGEESSRQIKLRANRLGVTGDNLSVMCSTDVLSIVDYINRNRPDAVIIDSIQTMNLSSLILLPEAFLKFANRQMPFCILPRKTTFLSLSSATLTRTELLQAQRFLSTLWMPCFILKANETCLTEFFER